MLPTPLISDWSSSARLSPVRRRRRAAATGVVVEGRVERVAGDVRDRHAGRRRPRSTTASPPKVRWSTKRSSGPPSAKANRTRRCVSSGASGGPHEQLAAHAEVGEQRLVAVASSGSHRYLPRRLARRRRVRPRSRAAKSAAPAGVPADRARVAAPRRRRCVRPATHRLEAAADDLDLGQLGHRTVLGRAQAWPAVGCRRRPAARARRCAPGGGRGLLLGLLLAAAGAARRTARRRPGRRR